MKITGTKKLLIIFLTLVCALTAGLFGVLFAGNNMPANAQTSAVKEDGGAKADGGTDAKISELADMLGVEYKYVNFYVHVNGTDVDTWISDLKLVAPDKAAKMAAIGVPYTEEKVNTDVQEELCLELEKFTKDYEDGLVTLSEEAEEEDWFISPDEAANFATYKNCLTYWTLWFEGKTQNVDYTWTVHPSPQNSSNARGKLWCETTLTLAAGESVAFKMYKPNDAYYSYRGGYANNEHWGYIDYMFGANPYKGTTSTFTIDGDAPTGTRFNITVASGGGNESGGYAYSSNGSLYLSPNGTATGSAGICDYYIYVIRENPEKMFIDNSDGLGTISSTTIANDTLTKWYEGTSTKISFGIDWGVGMVTWENGTDNGVSLYGRAVHANSGTAGRLILQVSTAGRFRIVLHPVNGAWKDGSTGDQIFYFEVKRQTTAKPKIVNPGDGSVAGSGYSKYVHDNGTAQSIEFLNYNPEFINYSHNGLQNATYTPNSGTSGPGRLSLSQTIQSTYTITFSLINPNGCTWDDGTIDPKTFTFTIAEMLVTQPTITTAGASGNKLSVGYDGTVKSMTLAPVIEGQVTIITSGVQYQYDNTTNSVTFSATDAAVFPVRIYPTKGYCWASDLSTDIKLYTFTIEALKLTAPVLDEPTAVGNTKTVDYDPTPGSMQTLTIRNFDMGGLTIVSAMNVRSYDQTTKTLVMEISAAQTYYVSFLCNTNYEWAPGVVAPTFVLVINKFVLGVPKIEFDGDENYIIGSTKTVQYVLDPSTATSSHPEGTVGVRHYFKLFVGGSSADQTNVVITTSTGAVLAQSWDPITKIITFSATEADNYLIELTPTANYQWAYRDEALRNFKLVVLPIYRDSIPMYVFNPNSKAYETAASNRGSLTYDGDNKYMRIGNPANINEFYDPTSMRIVYVDSNGAQITMAQSGLTQATADPLGQAETGCLYFYALPAGTYIVDIQLQNSNYNWRDGSDTDLYFYFTIEPRPLPEPYVVADECGGYNRIPYDTGMYGIYYGEKFSLVINVGASESILDVEFDQYNPVRPDGVMDMERASWSNATNYERLVVTATIVGTHICRLKIIDDNYSWENAVNGYYEFEITITQAEINGVDFYFTGYEGSLNADGSYNYKFIQDELLGSDGSSYNDATFNTDTVQNIIVRRSDKDEFTSTSFESQFEFSVLASSTGGIVTSYTINNVTTPIHEYHGTDHLKLSLLDVDMYVISITPTSNYCWAGGFTMPYQCILTINKKWVKTPYIYDLYDTNSAGDKVSDGTVHLDNQTRQVTFNRKEQELRLVLGDDYRAYKVNTNLTSSGLTATNVEYDVNNYPKEFAYLAKNAGIYDLTIELTNGNYYWDETDTYAYHLSIERLGVDLPEAYLADSRGYQAAQVPANKISFDYALAEERDYKAAYYYIYLFGDVIVNGDVEVEIAFLNARTDENMTHTFARNSIGGIIADEIGLQLVNEYTITVKFAKFTDAYNVEDCNYYWDAGDGTQLFNDHELKLKINKRAVDIPYIDYTETYISGSQKGSQYPTSTSSATGDPDSYYIYYTFDYGHHDMILRDYLPAFMGWTRDETRLAVDTSNSDVANGKQVFTTFLGANSVQYASVANTYCVEINLNSADDEKWNITLPGGVEDSAPKYFYIIMEKMPIALPTILNQGETTAMRGGATYAADGLSKQVTYDGDKWINYLTLQGVNATYMAYRLAASVDGLYDKDKVISTGITGELIISTPANAASYDIICSLLDIANMEWDGLGSSADLTFSFVVNPMEIAKAQVYDDGETGATFTLETKEITYDGSSHTFEVENLKIESDNRYMTIEVGSANLFLDYYYDAITDRMVYSARNAGSYTVKITLTDNACWSDGTRDVTLTFKINKIELPTLSIVADANATINQFDKTVTYELDLSDPSDVKEVTKRIEIANFDSTQMTHSGITITSDWSQTELNNTYTYNYNTATQIFYLDAVKAGNYELEFKLRDFANYRWVFADVETIKINFIIDKLHLDTPVINTDYLITGESLSGANNTTFDTTYDSKTHTVLIENVKILGDNVHETYMTYTSHSAPGAGSKDDMSVAHYATTEISTGVYHNVQHFFGADHGGLFTDTTVNLTDDVILSDLLELKAGSPGSYTVTIKLSDTKNMCWTDNTTVDITFKLAVGQFSHSAPIYQNGANNQPEYTGDEIYFFVEHAFNGCDTLSDWQNHNIVNFEYETATLNPPVSDVSGALWAIESWYNGTLTLKAKEVGTYSVTVSIKDPSTTKWTNGSSPKTFTFTIKKRGVTASVSYTDTSTTPGTAISNATWALDTPVTARITLAGIQGKNGVANPGTNPDKDIRLDVAYYDNSDPNQTLKLLKTIAAADFTTGAYNATNDTYTMYYDYVLPVGAENIAKGNYTIVVKQNGQTGNYTFTSTNFPFTVTAPSAPFTTLNMMNDLVWQYYASDDPTTITTIPYSVWSTYNSANGPTLPLTFRDGISYVFNLYMTPNASGKITGADGIDYDKLDAALLTWEVAFDTTYGNYGYDGTKSASYSGTYYISARIIAKDSDLFSYNPTVVTMYYTIGKIIYDLSDLYWDYDSADAVSAFTYVYDGTPKSIYLKSTTGAFPTGLSVKTYQVTDNTTTPVTVFASNTQKYAGTYITAVEFASSNKNYVCPDMHNPLTFINSGTTFSWTQTWTINQATLTVSWDMVQDNADGGSALVYVPTIAAPHTGKFDHIYEKEDTTTTPSTWNVVNNFDHTGSEQFRVTAVLKGTLVDTDPAYNSDSNYLRNYTLNFTGAVTSNPNVFTLGNGTKINAQVSVDGGTTSLVTTNTPASIDPSNVYVYTANPFAATVSLLGAPGGFTAANNIDVTYYSSVNYNKPLAGGAPSAPGKYKVKLTINTAGLSSEYELSQSEFYFEIAKGTFSHTDFQWQYKHVDSSNVTTTAHYDFSQGASGLWIWDSAPSGITSGSPVAEFTYDGGYHTVELVCLNTNLPISISMKSGSSYINAGKYTAIAAYSYDATKWNAPDFTSVYPNFTNSMEWVVEKAKISLAAIDWMPDTNYIYTRTTVNGTTTETAYKMEMTGIDPLLSNYVTYKTVYASDGSTVEDVTKINQAGSYITTIKIENLPDDSNYTIDWTTWPTYPMSGNPIPQMITWQIHKRIISLPTPTPAGTTGHWSAFDGNLHDLKSAIDLSTDWEEYYTISLQYSKDGTSPAKYDGTEDYGYEYSAFNSGKYYYVLKLISSINKDNDNIAFDDGTTAGTTSDQTVTLTVAKAAMLVTSWNIVADPKGYLSTIKLDEVGYYSYKFIAYTFFEGVGIGGNPTDLDAVLNSPTSQTFSISPYVKDEYGDNVQLTYATGVDDYHAFNTIDYTVIPDSDQTEVGEKPVILNYMVNGVLFPFEQEVLDTGTPFVIYSGSEVTFVIDMWDTYYSDYLDVCYGGKIEDLTQNEAGTYSITLTLKQSAANPLYWSKQDDGTGMGTFIYDRSPVTLTYQIKYKMLDVPSYEENAEYQLKEITYDGDLVDILKDSLGDAKYDELMQQYGDYVTIEGFEGTNAGDYKLVLSIKDEYLNTVRWNNGTEFGQPGKITVGWKILPIYLVKPTLNASKVLIYDGTGHTVFELLNGYGDAGVEGYLADVLRYASVSPEGSAGINAGTYTAVFTLPNTNFAWMDAAGNIDKSATTVSVIWTINRKTLSMSGVYWGYTEYDYSNDPAGVIKEYAYDTVNHYKYKLVDGMPYGYSMQLLGIPKELENFITYTTNGTEVNKVSAIGSYTTILFMSEQAVGADGNYSLTGLNPTFASQYTSNTGYLEIVWSIDQRQLTVPADDKELEFDNTIQDLLAVLDFEDGWENYFDVTVEFSQTGADGTWAAYEGDKDATVGYSIYHAFALGHYRLKLSIKPGLNTADSNNIVWKYNNNLITTDQQVTIVYNQLQIEITGWTDDLQESEVISAKLADLKLKDSVALEMFEYVIRDVDSDEVVTAEEVSDRGSGYSYEILFRIKPEYTYAKTTGVSIVWKEDGVVVPEKNMNPYEFGNYYFGSQTTIWMPMPEFEVDEYDFTGKDIVFKIKNWEDYVIDEPFRTAFNAAYAAENFEIGADVKSFIYAIDKSLDTENGTITVSPETKADKYLAKLRFISGVDLCWYDSSVYEVIGGTGGSLAYIGGAVLSDSDIESLNLKNRYAQKLSYTVNPRSVTPIDFSSVQGIEMTYTGFVLDVTKISEYATFFNRIKNDPLLTMTGTTGTFVGNDYTVVIELTYPESSYWNLGEYLTTKVETDEYRIEYVQENGGWTWKFVKVDAEGNIVTDAAGKYIEYNNGNYNRDGIKYKYSYSSKYIQIGADENSLLNEDGTPKQIVAGTDSEGNDYYYSYVMNEDGVTAKRYKVYQGRYIADSEGNYVARYDLDSEGKKILNLAYDLDSFGRGVIDYENSVITVTTLKTSVEPMTLNWAIVQKGLTAPYLTAPSALTYTGSEIKVTDYGNYLVGFDPASMEIFENGSATDAGTYTAKIKLTDPNYHWESEDGTELEYVTLIWSIDPATVDLSGVKWGYFDNEGNTYTSDSEFIYTRKNGNARIYYVGLVGLPDVAKNLFVYSTNEKANAFAGRNAGRYETEFAFNPANLNNYHQVTIPEELPKSLVWYINTRTLEIPTASGTRLFFEDKEQDLLAMIEGLPEDWSEYCNVRISYFFNGVPMAYEGYNGDPYKAYAAGAYRFNISIKSELNTGKT
ncbi:MAG: hypothetical protein K2L12_07610, partial [Clostridia bacterium]|nr:hypothetical protein [Clostridia bacterium]